MCLRQIASMLYWILYGREQERPSAYAEYRVIGVHLHFLADLYRDQSHIDIWAVRWGSRPFRRMLHLYQYLKLSLQPRLLSLQRLKTSMHRFKQAWSLWQRLAMTFTARTKSAWAFSDTPASTGVARRARDPTVPCGEKILQRRRFYGQ